MSNKNKQSDIGKDYNLKPAELKSFRDNYLTDDSDWWKVGATIYWSDEALDILSEYLFVKEQNEQLVDIENNRARVLVTGLAPNRKFVYAALDGNRITVKCFKTPHPSLAGKHIEVTCDHSTNETTYHYK